MKRILTMIIALAILGSMTFAGIAEQADTMEEEQAFEIIQNGSTGEAVRMLQTKLKGLGYQIGLVDGIFGPRTESGLRELQSAMGVDETGVVSSPEELDHILNSVKGDGINMVWDGRFQNREAYWSNWGHPTLCEIVEIDGQSWMHLISSGTHWEGLRQNTQLRYGTSDITELKAGQTYTLSFTAFLDADSEVRENDCCGIHNRSLSDESVQQQYWGNAFELTETPRTFSFSFTPDMDGSYQLFIGTESEGVLNVYYTDVKLEVGNFRSEWTEAESVLANANIN